MIMARSMRSIRETVARRMARAVGCSTMTVCQPRAPSSWNRLTLWAGTSDVAEPTALPSASSTSIGWPLSAWKARSAAVAFGSLLLMRIHPV